MTFLAAEAAGAAVPWRVIGIGAAVLIVAGVVGYGAWTIHDLRADLKTAQGDLVIEKGNTALAVADAKTNADALAEARRQHANDLAVVEGRADAATKAQATSTAIIEELQNEIAARKLVDRPVSPVIGAYAEFLRGGLPGAANPAAGGQAGAGTTAGEHSQMQGRTGSP